MNEEQKLMMIEMLDNNMTLKDIAKELGCTYEAVKYHKRKLGIIIKPINKKCEECGKKYQSSKKHNRFCSDKCRNDNYCKKRDMVCKCEVCNKTFAGSRNNNRFCSDGCRNIYAGKINTIHGLYSKKHSEEYKKDQEQKRAIKQLTKTLSLISQRTRACAHCNEIYVFNRQGNSFKFCSNECKHNANKINRRKQNKGNCKDKRLRRNGKVDYSITLEKLHERDNGVCHICNKKVDYDDFTITTDGHFIAGESYPSIDHVIPIAKGGLHRWWNVKLAHRGCNSEKSDKIEEIQLFLGI